MKTVLANTIGSEYSRKNASDGEDAFSYCGGNTGNVCFVDAIKQQLNTTDEISCYHIMEDGNKDKVYVLPSSNWINLDGHVLRDIFLPLEDADVKLAVLGLGVQFDSSISSNTFVSELCKNQETIKALKILSEHSKCIGVRGSITANCLDKIGIHNWKVIGCPSFYEPYRKKGSIHVATPSLEHVAINITPGKEGEGNILRYGYESNAEIILQTMSDMPLVLWKNRAVEDRHILSKFPGMSELTPEQVRKYIRNNGTMFFTRESWSRHLQEANVTFSVGSRFHGNMMALSHEIPALWVVHDVRTEELTEAMQLPFIYYDDLNYPMEKLLDKCDYNYKFINTYKKMGKEYINFLNQCEIEHLFECKEG